MERKIYPFLEADKKIKINPFLKKAGTNDFIVTFLLAKEHGIEETIVYHFKLDKLDKEILFDKLNEILKEVLENVKDEIYVHINVYQVMNTENEIVKELEPILYKFEEEFCNNVSYKNDAEKYSNKPLYDLFYTHFPVIPENIKKRKINEIKTEILNELEKEEIAKLCTELKKEIQLK